MNLETSSYRARQEIDCLFTKIPHDVLRVWISKLPSSSFKVLNILLDKTVGWKQKIVTISAKQIANELDVDITTVQRAIKILKDKELIIISKVKKTNKLCANTYEINFDKLIIKESFTYGKNAVSTYGKNAVSKNNLTQEKKSSHPYYIKKNSLTESKESASREAEFSLSKEIELMNLTGSIYAL